MQHEPQHTAAITPTIKVKQQVSCSVFDDRVSDMGTVTVENGKITVTLDFLMQMTTQEHTAQFLADAIGLGIRHCYLAHPASFEKR